MPEYYAPAGYSDNPPVIDLSFQAHLYLFDNYNGTGDRIVFVLS